jgi:hypothetical protein
MGGTLCLVSSRWAPKLSPLEWQGDVTGLGLLSRVTFSHEGCKITAISAYIPREAITAGKLTMWSRLQRFLSDRFRKGRVPTPSDYLFDVLNKWYLAGQAKGHAMVLLGDFNDTVDTRSQFGLCGWLNNLSLSAPLTDHFLPHKDYHTFYRAGQGISRI